MDVGIAGRPGKSDPYLKVTLGKQVMKTFPATRLVLMLARPTHCTCLIF